MLNFHVSGKGQINSKWFFQADDSSKNERNNSFFWPNSTTYKQIFSFVFWRNLSVPKSPFEINWPLALNLLVNNQLNSTHPPTQLIIAAHHCQKRYCSLDVNNQSWIYDIFFFTKMILFIFKGLYLHCLLNSKKFYSVEKKYKKLLIELEESESKLVVNMSWTRYVIFFELTSNNWMAN